MLLLRCMWGTSVSPVRLARVGWLDGSSLFELCGGIDGTGGLGSGGRVILADTPCKVSGYAAGYCSRTWFIWVSALDRSGGES